MKCMGNMQKLFRSFLPLQLQPQKWSDARCVVYEILAHRWWPRAIGCIGAHEETTCYFSASRFPSANVPAKKYDGAQMRRNYSGKCISPREMRREADYIVTLGLSETWHFVEIVNTNNNWLLSKVLCWWRESCTGKKKRVRDLQRESRARAFRQSRRRF